MAKAQGIIAILTREERIAILEATIDKEVVGTHTLRRFEETIRDTERLQAKFAGVVYAMSGGSDKRAIRAQCAAWHNRTSLAAKFGDSGQLMHDYYHGIEKALLAVLEALE